MAPASDFIVSFTGMVVPGAGRGHGMSFPTLNLQVQTLDLPHGVYAVQVTLPQGTFLGAMNWGPRPTFQEEEPFVEIHVLDFEGYAYGDSVEVGVKRFIREIRAFHSKEALMGQIAKDVEQVRLPC